MDKIYQRIIQNLEKYTSEIESLKEKIKISNDPKEVERLKEKLDEVEKVYGFYLILSDKYYNIC